MVLWKCNGDARTIPQTHLEYIRSCEEIWQKGMYVELHAYQHHVFMDWHFVDDSNWELVISNLNGAGVESISAKWDEMFGEKKEETVEEVKVKKPRKKAVAKKSSPARKPAVKKSAVKKTSAKKVVKKTNKSVAKKKSTALKANVKKSLAKETKKPATKKIAGKVKTKTSAKTTRAVKNRISRKSR